MTGHYDYGDSSIRRVIGFALFLLAAVLFVLCAFIPGLPGWFGVHAGHLWVMVTLALVMLAGLALWVERADESLHLPWVEAAEMVVAAPETPALELPEAPAGAEQAAGRPPVWHWTIAERAWTETRRRRQRRGVYLVTASIVLGVLLLVLAHVPLFELTISLGLVGLYLIWLAHKGRVGEAFMPAGRPRPGRLLAHGEGEVGWGQGGNTTGHRGLAQLWVAEGGLAMQSQVRVTWMHVADDFPVQFYLPWYSITGLKGNRGRGGASVQVEFDCAGDRSWDAPGPIGKIRLATYALSLELPAGPAADRLLDTLESALREYRLREKAGLVSG